MTLPPRRWDKETRAWEGPPDDDDWGELHFRNASPDADQAGSGGEEPWRDNKGGNGG